MYSRTRDEGFGAEVKRRIMLGTYVLSAGYYDAFYLKAQQVRTLLRRDYEQAFERWTWWRCRRARHRRSASARRRQTRCRCISTDIFTVSANLAGLPGISVPCGFAGDRLPVGLQLTGRMFDEETRAARRGRLRARDGLAQAELVTQRPIDPRPTQRADLKVRLYRLRAQASASDLESGARSPEPTFI